MQDSRVAIFPCLTVQAQPCIEMRLSNLRVDRECYEHMCSKCKYETWWSVAVYTVHRQVYVYFYIVKYMLGGTWFKPIGMSCRASMDTMILVEQIYGVQNIFSF